MPVLWDYCCDACEHRILQQWGDNMFVIDDQGKRHPCLHPGEDADAAHHLGLSMADYHAGLFGEGALSGTASEAERERVRALAALIDARVGVTNRLTCVDCGHSEIFDLRHKPQACPTCSGTELLPAHAWVGKVCPQCRQGTIQQVDTGLRT